MSTATLAGLVLLPLLSSGENRAVWYSLTFCENLMLLLGLLRAHPVCRGRASAMSSGSVLEPLESEEQLLISAVLTDENFRAHSLLITSYWLTLPIVCLPMSWCSSSCPNVSKASKHPRMEHSKSGTGLSIFLLTSKGAQLLASRGDHKTHVIQQSGAMLDPGAWYRSCQMEGTSLYQYHNISKPSGQNLPTGSCGDYWTALFCWLKVTSLILWLRWLQRLFPSLGVHHFGASSANTKWCHHIEGSEAYVGVYNVPGNLDPSDRWDPAYGSGQGIDFHHLGSDFHIPFWSTSHHHEATFSIHWLRPSSGLFDWTHLFGRVVRIPLNCRLLCCPNH